MKKLQALIKVHGRNVTHFALDGFVMTKDQTGQYVAIDFETGGIGFTEKFWKDHPEHKVELAVSCRRFGEYHDPDPAVEEDTDYDTPARRRVSVQTKRHKRNLPYQMPFKAATHSDAVDKLIKRVARLP